VFGFILVLGFHLMNARLFGIGIFPWFMIAATLIFFNPDWPVQVVACIRRGRGIRFTALVLGTAGGFLAGALLPRELELVPAVIAGLGGAVLGFHLGEPFQKSRPITSPMESADNYGYGGPGTAGPGLTGWQKCTLGLLGLWVGFQVLVPLRHLVIPGSVHWTEEGQKFAWHMKLRDKNSESLFLVTDAVTGRHWVVDPHEHLTSVQVFKMASRPDMILQYAHHLEKLARDEGHLDVEVRVRVVSSLNGRPGQDLVDPGVDLTEVPRPWFGHADWILPLEAPLPADN
jgi:hypothetical protein